METGIQSRLQRDEETQWFFRFRSWRFDKGFEIRDSCLVPLESAAATLYEPLEEYPDLVLEFAEVDTPGRALQFANRYGMLGFASERPHDKHETLAAWLGEAAGIRFTFDLWSHIESRNSRSLRRMIEWDRDAVYFRHPGMSERPLIAHRSDKISPMARWMNPATGWRQSELLGPAKVYLARLISHQLTGTSLRIALDSDQKIREYLAPPNLRGALWLQLSQYVTGEKQLRKCEICGKPMDVTGRRSHKSVHVRCSRRLRMQRWRASREGESK